MKEERLQEIVQHAYDHSPAFRERLDGAGVGPEEIKTLADLSRVPVFTKDEAIARQQADPPFGGMLAAPRRPSATSSSPPARSMSRGRRRTTTPGAWPWPCCARPASARAT